MLEPKNLKRIEKPVDDLIDGAVIFKYCKDDKHVHARFDLYGQPDLYIGVKTDNNKINVEIGRITISFDGKKSNIIGEIITNDTLQNDDCYIIYVPKTKEIYSINEITKSFVKVAIERYDEHVNKDYQGDTIRVLTKPVSVSEKLRNIIELRDDKF